MIVEDQENIKVHFAGAEDINLTQLINQKAGINYHLFSVYQFIRKNQKNDLDFIQKIEKISKHTIMDSGLFTLMFGAEKGKKDEKFLDEWTQKIINFILKTGYLGTYVDVDCQKILGVEKAWEYRELMKKELPKNRQINVFHIEDGQKGLEKLIEYSDYIAISVPELRQIKKKEYLYIIYNYIKNKKPDIDIHLLGFTEFNGLKKYKEATSCDSVSWKQCSMYGQLLKFNHNLNKIEYYDNIGKKTSSKSTRVRLNDIGNLYKEDVKKFFKKELTERSIINYGIDIFMANEYKKIASYYAGCQD
jgi:CRISPR/Cas system-associated protein endoribonuclease Cas2